MPSKLGRDRARLGASCGIPPPPEKRPITGGYGHRPSSFLIVTWEGRILAGGGFSHWETTGWLVAVITMADVFISYPKARRALTERVARDLEAAGLSVWWDTRIQLGEGFRNQIDDQLDACKAAIVIWTPESIKSD